MNTSLIMKQQTCCKIERRKSADCLPRAALPPKVENVVEYIQTSVSKGRRWEALAKVIERLGDDTTFRPISHIR